MAISWGPWVANNRWRVGGELKYSGSPSSGSVTVTHDVWFQVRYASSESGQSGTKWGTSGVVGSFNDTFGWNLPAMGTVKLGSRSASVALTYGSTKTVTGVSSATVAYTYPGSGSVSLSLTLPARPYSAPAAPSGVALVRGSGESLTVSWTRNATTNAPYSSIEVQWLNSKTSAWYTGATVSGGASSYGSTGATDRRYRARVRAVNSAGASSWAYTDWVSTTPATPGAPSATKNVAGDIVVSIPAAASGSSRSDVEIWHAADGVWDGARLALYGAGSTTFTHISPDPSKTHTYRLRAVSTAPTLYSGYSGSSNMVQLLAPPNAPTNLAPNGKTQDAAVQFLATYRHNPVDTTAQRRKQFRYRPNGGAWITDSAYDSTAESIIFLADRFTNGDTVEWQVRTWGSATTGGSDGTGASPWSQVAVVAFSTTPTVAINTPDGVTPVDMSRVSTTWGYFQAEGKPQAQWQARIKGATGAVLETLSGSGDATSATFKTAVQDGASYTVEVRVQSSVGLWSGWAAQGFTVDYAEPPAPTLTAWWQPGDGVVALDVDQPGPAEGQVEAVQVQVWRAVDGDDWRLIAEVEPGTSVTDFIPALGRINFYKATAVSALPSMADSDVVEVLTSGAQHVFLNAGPGFSQSVRLTSNVKVGIESGREKTLHQFAGRARPVEFAGEGRSRTISLAADIAAPWLGQADLIALNSTWDEVEALADLPAPACYRDPEGRRYFVSISPASIGGLGTSALTGVAATLTEVDWVEPSAGSDA